MAATEPIAPPAPDRVIAITFDDLPVTSVVDGSLAFHRAVMRDLLASLSRHGMIATGFVNGIKLDPAGRGFADPERMALLRAWIDAGHDLGNHTFSHCDLHAVTREAFEADMICGEEVPRALLAERGRTLRWFRHPYLHTGRDPKADARIRSTLAHRGVRVAPATVVPMDYLFSAAWEWSRRRDDTVTMTRVVTAYREFIGQHLENEERLSRRRFGREIPQILDVHANALNAAHWQVVADCLQARGYRVIPLDAIDDPAYELPAPFADDHHAGWLERWCRVNELPADGTATPEWILEAARTPRGVGFRRWLLAHSPPPLPAAVRRLRERAPRRV
jgi:peptidoglycan/xylan/chitin deacetylase (PgdA/CDA1 family)